MRRQAADLVLVKFRHSWKITQASSYTESGHRTPFSYP
ncbi:uncharacterized protein METZ01_LOCUS204535 [marine metagenome]|uniref:Uncharacterized protein n=1 Tax=marine metagenome TaxID=408172 RepID=A0A382ENY2_9ZZZZ